MTTIRVFLASSIVEFRRERMELAAFVLSLNNEYVRRGRHVELTLCEDLSSALARQRKQDEYNRKIRASDVFCVLFGEEAGQYTVEEFETARAEFAERGAPLILTFFRARPESQAVSESIAAFRARLAELGQESAEFTGLDAVKARLKSELDRLCAGDASPVAGGEPELRFIKLFLAASAEESERDDLMELTAFVQALNNDYIRRDIYFELMRGEDLSRALAEEDNRRIRESRYFYVIFGRGAAKEAVAVTLEAAFNVAFEQFSAKGRPNIYTYFRKLPEGLSAAKGVAAFMEHLDKELKHYYNIFENLDAVKLNLLLELTRSPEIGGSLKFEEGMASVDGRELLSLESLPLYSKNEELQRLRAERDRLAEEVAFLRTEYEESRKDEENENGGGKKKAKQRVEKFKKLMGAADARQKEAAGQVRRMEAEMLALCTTIAERTTSGRPVTKREKEAARMLEAGDYDGALALLRDEECERELEQAELLAEAHCCLTSS